MSIPPIRDDTLSSKPCHEDKTCFPIRFQIATMLFASITISFLLRSSISLNILAMVKNPSHHEQGNHSTVVLQNFGPRYDWSALQQSILLMAAFAGSILIIIPFGILLDRFGHARQIVLCSGIVSAVLQFAGPMAAAFRFEAMAAILLCTGILQGSSVLVAHKMFTTWAPPAELGIFTSVIMGTNCGTIIAWTMSGALIEWFGWRYSFYANGAIMCVFVVCWWLLVYDSPAQHPAITVAERSLVERSLEGVHRASTSWPPIWSIVTSVPAWCLLLLQFGNLWGMFFLLTAAPRFVNEILGFQLAGTGVMASMPYLARWLASIGWAVIGKRMHQNSGWSLLNLRKFFCVFSHFLPGLLFCGVPYVSGRPFVCIAFIAVSQAFNGAAPQSTFATFHDIAPNYAVSMVSIINTICSFSGLLAPMLVAHLTAERNTIAEWRWAFGIAALGYAVPALVFWVAGSASVQPWDGCDHSSTAAADATNNDAKKEGHSNAGCKHVADTKDRCVRGMTISPMFEM